jgi:hypothetical protein
MPTSDLRPEAMGGSSRIAVLPEKKSRQQETGDRMIQPAEPAPTPGRETQFLK